VTRVKLLMSTNLLQMAGAHDFINQLDKGYECLISDLGSNLRYGNSVRVFIWI
jgi:ABC-type bacteriocin/lantibiotic exporter with double-glycine peptidase domain